MDKKLDAYVPSDCMKQVIASLAIAVSVSCNSDYCHFVVGKFQPGSNRKAPSMKTIEGIAFR